MATPTLERWIPKEVRAGMVMYIAASCDPMRGPYFEHLEFMLELVDDEQLESACDVVAMGLDLQRDDRYIMQFVGNLVTSGTPKLMLAVSTHLDFVKNGETTLYALTDLLGTLINMELIDSPMERYAPLQAHINVLNSMHRSSSSYYKDADLVRLVHDQSEQHAEIIKLMEVDGIKGGGLIREHLNNASPALSNGIL